MNNFIDGLIEHKDCSRCEGMGWIEVWEPGCTMPDHNGNEPTHDEPCPDCLQTGIQDFAYLIDDLKNNIAKALLKAKAPNSAIFGHTPLTWNEGEGGIVASEDTKEMYLKEAETLLGA